MNQINGNVKAITFQNGISPHPIFPQSTPILQPGDRAITNLCGEFLPGIITEPLIEPCDVEAVRGAEYLIKGDRHLTWRVQLLSDRLLVCSPRESVFADGGAE